MLSVLTKAVGIRIGNTEQATDDAEYTLSGVAQIAVILYNGSISPTTYNTRGIVGDFWNTPYFNVRRVNVMLEKLPSTPLSAGLQSRVKGEILFYGHGTIHNFDRLRRCTYCG